MRAAVILAEMLLAEANARAFAVVFGPGLPDQGYYVVGDTEHEIFSKMATGFDTGVSDIGTQIETWMAKGYTVLLQKNNGSIVVYGNAIELAPALVQGMELTPETEIGWVHFVGNQTGADYSNASQVLGVTEPKKSKVTKTQQKNLAAIAAQSEFEKEVSNYGGLASQPSGSTRQPAGPRMPRMHQPPRQPQPPKIIPEPLRKKAGPGQMPPTIA